MTLGTGTVRWGDALGGLLALTAGLAILALVLGGWVGVRLGARVLTFAGAWCVSLLLCAIFPTGNGKRILSTAGMVHQVAGMLDGRAISGLVQRVLFGLEAAMPFTLAVRLPRVEVPG